MTKPPEPKEAEAPFRCPNCDGLHFRIMHNGQLECASYNHYEMNRGAGCGWRGALQEPQMEIAKCL